MDVKAEALARHEEYRGKLEVNCKMPLQDKGDLTLAYTPGVAEPARLIAKDPSLAYRYTFKSNMCAMVSDGSAVLGLGNIGGLAALPVMEGKSAMFKRFGGVDMFPIVLDTQDTEEIIRTCVAIAPTFGAINLEDIAAPRCFEIERRLQQLLDIPVFHDDQEGSGIITAAALFNAFRLTNRRFETARVVICGAGAAGTATARTLLSLGVKDMIVLDSHGILTPGREHQHWAKEELAAVTNPRGIIGGLAEAVRGADVFIGLSRGRCMTEELVRSMAKDPIVLAMSNPEPEILPSEAMAAGAAVAGTGRSDLPNQVNNILVYPGIFRGALDVRARCINDEMGAAAARAVAELISDGELSGDHILPGSFDPRVTPAVAAAVAEAARKTGVARV